MVIVVEERDNVCLGSEGEINSESGESKRAEIIKALAEKHRRIASISLAIAELYNFARMALEFDEVSAVVKAEKRIEELRRNLRELCAEERELKVRFEELLRRG